MKVVGTVIFDPRATSEIDLVEAILTRDKFAADWDSDGTPVCMVTHSKDGGVTYSGKCGSRELEPGS